MVTEREMWEFDGDLGAITGGTLPRQLAGVI